MAKGRDRSRGATPLRKIDRWMYLTYLALLVTVPLAFSRTPIEFFDQNLKGLTFDQFDIAKILTLRLLTLAILVLWVAKLYSARKARVRLTPADVAVLVFLLLASISTVLSVHFPTSLHGKYKRYEGLLTYINYAMLYFLAMQTFYNDRRLKALAKVMAITGGLVALYGLAQFAGWDIYHWASLPFEKHRSFSTYGNPDLLAGYLVIVLPFSISALLTAEGRRDLALYSITTALISVNIIASLVRGAWFATAVVFAIFLIFLVVGYVRKRVPREAIVRMAASAAIFLAICVVATYFASTLGEPNLDVIERLKSMTKAEGSIASRLEIWKAGLSMIEARPFFGFGPDTFRLASQRYETAEYVKIGAGKTVSDNAHNYLIQLAAGPGVLATLAFLAFMLVVFARSAAVLFRQSGERLVIGTGLFAAAIGYFVHLLSGVSVSGSTALFWVVAGALAGTTPLLRERSLDWGDAVNKAIVGLVVLVSAASFVYAAKMFAADYYYAKGLSISAFDVEGTIENYKTAISLYKNGRYYDSLGTYYLQLYGYRKNPGDFESAVSVLKEAVAFEPLEADHRVFLANAYLTNPTSSNLKQARIILEDTLANVRPRSVPALFLLAEENRMEKSYAEAVERYRDVLAYDSNHDSSLLGLAMSYESLGSKKEALFNYRRVVSINPNSEVAREAIKRLQ